MAAAYITHAPHRDLERIIVEGAEAIRREEGLRHLAKLSDTELSDLGSQYLESLDMWLGRQPAAVAGEQLYRIGQTCFRAGIPFQEMLKGFHLWHEGWKARKEDRAEPRLAGLLPVVQYYLARGYEDALR
jgi:uncharacterized protein YjiS (DUF1127 family)